MSTCERGRATRQGRAALVALLLSVALTSVAAPARADTAEITMANRAFSPGHVTVKAVAGEAEQPGLHAHVNFRHRDPGLEHSIAFDDASVPGPSGRLSDGQVYPVEIEAPGTYTYRCEIHPDMTGTIVVTASAPGDGDGDGGDGGSSGPGGALLVVAAAVVLVGGAAALFVARRRRA